MRDCTLLVQFILVPSSNNQITEWEEIVNIYINQTKNDFVTPDIVIYEPGNLHVKIW